METESKPALKNFGRLKTFGFVNGDPFFCVGPDWHYFLCMFSFFLVVGLVFVLVVCPLVGSTSTVMAVFIYGFLLLNYLLAAVINPGVEMRTEPYPANDEYDIENFCSRCQVYREERTEHCDDCGVCIQEYDHHCPWTSKCIGRGNLCFFYNFLFGVLIAFVFSIGALAMLGQGSRKL